MRELGRAEGKVLEFGSAPRTSRAVLRKDSVMAGGASLDCYGWITATVGRSMDRLTQLLVGPALLNLQQVPQTGAGGLKLIDPMP